jgi:hypothetical protein
MKSKRLQQCAVGLTLVLAFGASCVAETSKPVDEKVISDITLEQFQELVPQELRSLVQRNIIAFKVVPAPDSSKEVGAVIKKAKGKEKLLVEQAIKNLYRFGLSDDRGTFEASATVKTGKWNEGETSVKNEPSVFTSEWKISREFFSTQHSPRAFQEEVVPLDPEPLLGFSFVTTRWSEPGQEDFVEEDSPVTKSKRRLTETNRSDLILNSGLSLNDFMLVGLNPSKVSIQEVTAVDAYMPAPVTTIKNRIKESCYSYSSGELGPVDTMFESVPVANLRVLRVEYHSAEPFSLYPSGVLYVDPLYNAPLVHLQFDQTARLARASFYQLSYVPLYSVREVERREYLPLETLVLNLKEKQNVSVQYLNQTTCEGSR